MMSRQIARLTARLLEHERRLAELEARLFDLELLAGMYEQDDDSPTE